MKINLKPFLAKFDPHYTEDSWKMIGLYYDTESQLVCVEIGNTLIANELAVDKPVGHYVLAQLGGDLVETA